MPNDRLRHDRDDVEQLDDIIEARDEGTSHFARDVDAAETDFDVPEDIDVDAALTFPHPKRKPNGVEDIELMDTPRKDDIGIDWQESQEEMLPTDYKDDYDDALTTNIEEEEDVVEEQIAQMGDMGTGDLIYGTHLVTRVPSGFQLEEGPPDKEGTPPVEMGQHPGELESAMDTESDEDDFSVQEKFGGEVDPEKAKELLRRTRPEGDEG